MQQTKPQLAVRVFPGIGFISSYAGTEYLLRGLQNRGLQVNTFMRVPDGDRDKYRSKGLEFCFAKIWSQFVPSFLRRFARLWERGSILARMLFSRIVLITESAHLREAALAKKILGNRLFLIHFSQELLLLDELPRSGDALFYREFSRYADVTIDVDTHRALIRKEKMHLSKMPFILLNTLPLDNLPERKPSGCLGCLAGTRLPKDKIIVLYTGILAQNKPFSRIAEAFAKIQHKAFLVAFCGGDQAFHAEAVTSAKELLSEGTWCIQGLVPRNDILSCSWEADIGVVDYSPSLENTTNQRFCAPTKLYEYMSAGLAIAGSDNPSLFDVVEREAIGYCAQGGSGSDLGDALAQIVENPVALLEMKRRSRQLFEEKYCYEKACLPVISEIADLIIEANK